LTADPQAGSGEAAGFQYAIANDSGGVGFASVDIMIDDMSTAA